MPRESPGGARGRLELVRAGEEQVQVPQRVHVRQRAVAVLEGELLRDQSLGTGKDARVHT